MSPKAWCYALLFSAILWALIVAAVWTAVAAAAPQYAYQRVSERRGPHVLRLDTAQVTPDPAGFGHVAVWAGVSGTGGGWVQAGIDVGDADGRAGAWVYVETNDSHQTTLRLLRRYRLGEPLKVTVSCHRQLCAVQVGDLRVRELVRGMEGVFADAETYGQASFTGLVDGSPVKGDL